MLKRYFLVLFFCTGVFIQTNAQYTMLYNFGSPPDGREPGGTLISDGVYLYGLGGNGGSNEMGTLFKIKHDGSEYSTLIDFVGVSNGDTPRGLFLSGSYLYGMTFRGGLYDYGTIYRVKTDGTEYLKLLDFEYFVNGGYPRNSLISDGLFLYGMNEQKIFKIMPDGSAYMELYEFTGGSNSGAFGSLFFDGTFLYGTTSGSSTLYTGAIFKLLPDGTDFEILLDFDGTNNGSAPYCTLVSEGTFLYGMTYSGGTYDKGTIFKLKTDGSGYSKLMDFAGETNGAEPYGSLYLEGSCLYGMTSRGGNVGVGEGTLFKINTDGTGYVKLIDFAKPIGWLPSFTTLISDGKYLYGMTGLGGPSTVGTVFRYHYTATYTADSLITNEFLVYPNPTNGITNLVFKNEPIDSLLQIINGIGQIVIDVKLPSLQPGENYQLDLSSLAAGVYFIRYNNSSTRIVKY